MSAQGEPPKTNSHKRSADDAGLPDRPTTGPRIKNTVTTRSKIERNQVTGGDSFENSSYQPHDLGKSSGPADIENNLDADSVGINEVTASNRVVNSEAKQGENNRTTDKKNLQEHITYGPSIAANNVVVAADGAKETLLKMDTIIDSFIKNISKEEYSQILGWPFPNKEADFWQELQKVKVHTEIIDQAFFFESVPAAKVLKFGPHLLNPLITKKLPWLEKFAVIFLLHECYHVFVQHLYSENYQGIGRADTVLEEIDFYADAFAMVVAARYFAAERGQSVKDAAVDMVKTSLEIFTLFDNPASGEQILAILPERRLRRYLIWHMMLLRLNISGKLEADDLQAFFTQRSLVQLATLNRSVDSSQEVIVANEQPENLDLHVCINSVYYKFPSQTRYKAVELINHVRKFDIDGLQDLLSSLVAQHRDVLRFK